MAMAAKRLLCFTLLCLLSLSAIASSSIHRCESIAWPPDPFPTSDSFVPRFSSFLSKGSKGFHVPRKLSQGLISRGRSFAEVVNKTSNSTSNEGDQSVGSAPPAAKPSDDKQLPAVKWLACIALGIATGINILAILAYCIYRFGHEYIKRPKPVVFQRRFIDSKALAFLEKECALEALELLGKGGCGEVFKTTLENGKVVAIKKVRTIAANNSQGVDATLEQSYDLTKNSAQIHAELDTLGQIRHRNLVTLLAYVPKPDAHILIYDFMENGSLHDALMKVWEGSLELTWPMRHKIAVGVAMGLKYLHFDCSPKIIHRDLKPGNILLDHDMEAHIGDFGLAKLMPDNFTHFTSNNLTGTVGYIAPEYHQTLRYTAKGDVYSFGVVLVVLLTGKEPTNHLFSDVYTHMGSWVTDILASGEDSAMAFLDEHLHTCSAMLASRPRCSWPSKLLPSACMNPPTLAPLATTSSRCSTKSGLRDSLGWLHNRSSPKMWRWDPPPIDLGQPIFPAHCPPMDGRSAMCKLPENAFVSYTSSLRLRWRSQVPLN